MPTTAPHAEHIDHTPALEYKGYKVVWPWHGLCVFVVGPQYFDDILRFEGAAQAMRWIDEVV